MAFDAGLVDWVIEAMEPVGTVTFRKMMGGAVLYLDGVVFAVVDDGEVWLKGDAESEAIWDEAGCDRFTFTGSDGQAQVMNYRRAPSDVYDDAEAMREWAAIAVAAGQRAAVKKRPKKPKA
ncbi:TfoX/Sxy family protein [Sphingomonas sp. AOB5]|uniref:TfoX/Sxy family protein n=1 Tax=Sphingomonas sp. AOB5 TaxID=3034017 RepID=UPI0023F7F9A8|nr:TfoX/Sxy family protein [Sphingomonas sp. AOB5]MDF7775150.1 TfoX/Sxy family protein [Sphingomonas sp. AOB5]